jgi:hypothetical protein
LQSDRFGEYVRNKAKRILVKSVCEAKKNLALPPMYRLLDKNLNKKLTGNGIGDEKFKYYLSCSQILFDEQNDDYDSEWIMEESECEEDQINDDDDNWMIGWCHQLLLPFSSTLFGNTKSMERIKYKCKVDLWRKIAHWFHRRVAHLRLGLRQQVEFSSFSEDGVPVESPGRYNESHETLL